MTHRQRARKIWPDAEEISGDGPAAVVSLCPPFVTVSLHADWQAAWAARAHLDRGGCGGRCDGRSHEVHVMTAMPARAFAPHRRAALGHPKVW